MSKTTEVIIKPTTKKQVKRIKSENEVLKNDDEHSSAGNEAKEKPVKLQNRFNKSNPEDMKRLKLLKDKIRRCELQLAKHQSKLESLNAELNALNSQ